MKHEIFKGSSSILNLEQNLNCKNTESDKIHLGLGDRWAPVILNSVAEFDVVKYGIAQPYNESRYYIGGSTNGSYPLQWEDYLANYSGNY